jgi:ABC-type multidrug transport system permease subunit
MMNHPLIQLTLLRLRGLTRQPEAIFWTVGFPLLMTCALGIAFRNTAPTKMRVAVDASLPNAPAIANTLSQSAELDGVLLAPADSAQQLRSGKVALIVTTEGAPAMAYRYDPTRPESRTARMLVDNALQQSAGRSNPVMTCEQTVSESGARYIDFLIPGLIGMNLLGSGLWGVGFTIVLARVDKLLKQLAATPMRRAHYLASFMLARLLLLVPEIVVLMSFAYLTFGVRMQGHWLSFFLIATLANLAFVGIGLLIAARTKTIEGASGLMNLVILPMWVLSGTFFSAARFPDFVQPFIKALPLTAVNDGLRAVMNEGATLASQGLPLAVLAAWTVMTFVVALRIFRWQ